MNGTDRPDRVDDAYRALAHPLRRATMHLLAETRDHATTLTDLGERLATRFDDATAGRMRTRLHHVHLPTLAELGFVEYDARSGAVRYEPSRRATDVVDAVLADCARPD